MCLWVDVLSSVVKSSFYCMWSINVTYVTIFIFGNLLSISWWLHMWSPDLGTKLHAAGDCVYPLMGICLSLHSRALLISVFLTSVCFKRYTLKPHMTVLFYTCISTHFCKVTAVILTHCFLSVKPCHEDFSNNYLTEVLMTSKEGGIFIVTLIFQMKAPGKAGPCVLP